MPYQPTGNPPGRPTKNPWEFEWLHYPNLTKKQWKAVELEAEGLDWERAFQVERSAVLDPELIEDLTDLARVRMTIPSEPDHSYSENPKPALIPLHEQKPFPSNITNEAIANHAGVKPRTIHSWRSEESYCHGICFLVIEPLLERLGASDNKRKEDDLIQSAVKSLTKLRGNWKGRLGSRIATFIHAEWEREGYSDIKNPFNDKTYSSPESYVSHLTNNELFPTDVLDATIVELSKKKVL